jgi:histidinol phosphatase-like PHP family hydrolase
MINLHSHTLHSDGCLLPSELAVRYAAAGYQALAITDHADYSNIGTAVKAVMTFCAKWPANAPIRVFPGIELTHLPLVQFAPLVRFARREGILVVVAHGETTVEPVIPGTNRAAIEAGIDILAHPGLISDEDAQLAGDRGVFLEITSRRGHGNTNAHVAAQALKFGCRIALNHDAHAPEDIISLRQTRDIGLAAGLSEEKIDAVYADAAKFIAR